MVGIDDEELMRFIEAASAKIIVVGAGGSGSNTLSRMTEVGIVGAKTIAMNTDARHLLVTKADQKLILGKKLTRGLGAGSDPAVGEEAAKESYEEIKQLIQGSDMVFITCGMGGGTGTGSASVIAKAAKEIGALTVGVVTLPFSAEGKIRWDNAIKGLKKLRKDADTVIVIPNDKLLSLAPDLPLNAAFKIADQVLTDAVKGITEMVTKPGLVNMDFANLKTIMQDGGYAVIGIGENTSESENDKKADIVVRNAINSPLLDADISKASRALVDVVGGPEMTLKEAEYIVNGVSRQISSEAHVIWGAIVDNELQKSVLKALVILTGVLMPDFEQKEGEEALDLDYVD